MNDTLKCQAWHPGKLLIFMLLLLLPARTTLAQVGYGPEVGFGAATMRFAPDQAYSSATTTAIPAFKLGAIIEKNLNSHLFFQTGISFDTRGQKRKYAFYVSDSLNAAVDQTWNLYYAMAPLNILYKTGKQGKGRVIMGIGVMPGFLLHGKNKLHASGKQNDTAFNTSSTTALESGADAIPRFDLGINLIAGYELPTGLFFRVGYTAGFTDLGQQTEIDKNRFTSLSVGYYFGKGRNINKETDDLIDRSPQ